MTAHTSGIRRVAAPLLVLLAVHPVHAQPSCGAARIESAKCLFSDLITALSIAQTVVLTQPNSPDSTSAFLAAANALASSARQRQGIERALATVSPYVIARDSAVRMPAYQFSMGLFELYGFLNSADSAVRRVLNGHIGSPADEAQKLAALNNRRTAARTLLWASVAEATHALLETNPRDTARMRLAITANDYKELKSHARVALQIGRDRSGNAVETDYSLALAVIEEFLFQNWPTRP